VQTTLIFHNHSGLRTDPIPGLLRAFGKRWLRGLVLGLALVSAAPDAQASKLFPRPAELEPAIHFWVRVYTEVDTSSGFLHDSQNLAVVYARLPLDDTEIEATRRRIQQDLRTLATGKRSGLTASQQKTLAAWPAKVGNKTLLAAVDNVRWQLGQSDRFLGGLQRSGAYRKHIDTVIRDKGLPLELGALPHVESSFNPSAYSSAAAAGMWQFTRATGQRFMRIDHVVDERMDPYMAADAAMSLLQYNYRALGTWPLALTAYNHGTSGIARAVRETGTKDIGTIVATYKGRAFGFASRNFYAQFLAVLQVEKDAKRYFGKVRMDPAPRFVEVNTDAFIDADVFARSTGTTLEQLRADNPALRPVVWEGNKRIPEGFPVKLRADVVDSRNPLALVPGEFKYKVQTPDVAYVVVGGDSLSVIARRFDTTVARLVAFNQLTSSHRIKIGQRLLLPQDNTSSARLAEAAAIKSADGIYTVRSGDTVSVIATRYDTTGQALMALNGIRDPHRIYPGQQMYLPGFGHEAKQVAGAGVSPPPGTAPRPVKAEVRPETAASTFPAEPELPVTLVAAAQIPKPAPDSGLLPPAAVLPDGQQLATPVTEAEGSAVALDPALDVTQRNGQLSEALAADPSDYSVAGNNSIEIQASETLGHYAYWLGVQSSDLRRLNKLASRDRVIIGRRLRLDFSGVSSAEFELKRRQYHAALQRDFFSNYHIKGVEEYQVKRNDSIGSIARKRYATPIWLLVQYNPTLDFNRIQIGQKIVFPLLELSG